MKLVSYVLIFALLLSLGCQTAPVSYSDKENPCKDSTLAALKLKPVDSLSNREFQYLMKLEADCREFSTKMKDIEASSKSSNTAIAVIGIIGFLAAIGVVYYFATKKKTIEISY